MGGDNTPASSPAAVAPSPNDDGSIRGRTVSAHVSQGLVDAIGRVCEREQRSISSTLRMLIRSGLAHHGEAQPAPATTEPGPHRRRLAAAERARVVAEAQHADLE
jgi:hypothetical protein